jgi:PIN domain nuclease of toxin-antitoxin system
LTVLDAYAVLALLKDEGAAELVEQVIREDRSAALTALGLAEVLDHLIRLAGVEEDDAVLDIAQIGLSEPFSIDADLARRAGMLRARHYHRKARSISLADCVAAEVARLNGVAVATADPHLLDTCHAEGVSFIALPDTNGASWSP